MNWQNILLTKEEQIRMIQALREYFSQLASEKTKYLRFGTDKQFILLNTGISLIVLSDIASKIIKVLIPELFLIIGWVDIWEMLNSIFLSNRQNKIERDLAKKIAKCEVEFK